MNLSKREKFLIHLLVIVAVFGLYSTYLCIPKYEEAQANGRLLDDKRQELVQVQHLKDSGGLDVKRQEVNEKWTKASSAIPMDMKLPELYMDFLSLGRQTGIAFNALEFGTIEQLTEDVYDNGRSLWKMDIQMDFSGTYEQVDSFLKGVYQNPRRVEVTKLLYESEDGKIHATIEANAFAFSDEGKEVQTQYNFNQGSYDKSDPFARVEPENAHEKQADDEQSPKN